MLSICVTEFPAYPLAGHCSHEFPHNEILVEMASSWRTPGIESSRIAAHLLILATMTLTKYMASTVGHMCSVSEHSLGQLSVAMTMGFLSTVILLGRIVSLFSLCYHHGCVVNQRVVRIRRAEKPCFCR